MQNPTIVIVENDTSWREKVVDLLKREYRESREFVLVDGVEDFMRRFGTRRSYDNVSCILVDLELGPHFSDREMNDTWGLDKILPTIRKHAPWLPVVCVSSFAEAPDTASQLSVTDFDAVYAKSLFYHPIHDRTGSYFSENRWREINQHWREKRAAWLMGIPVSQVAQLGCQGNTLELVCTEKIEREVQVIGKEGLRAAMRILGIEAQQVSLTEVVGSFSGVVTVRGVANGVDGAGEYQLNCLIKWGKPVRKLFEEAEGYKRWMMRGMIRQFLVPQFLPTVLVWEEVGFLVYYFESEARTVKEYEKAKSNSAVPCLEKLFERAYSNAARKQYNARDIFERWFGLGPIEGEKIANAYGIQRPLEVSNALIHGDLHLSNILICNDDPLLIDFANSCFGPVALDAAKLIVDAAVFLKSPADLGTPPSITAILQTDLAHLTRALLKYLNRADDHKLLEALIYVYAMRYLDYEDPSAETKDALRKIVASI